MNHENYIISDDHHMLSKSEFDCMYIQSNTSNNDNNNNNNNNDNCNIGDDCWKKQFNQIEILFKFPIHFNIMLHCFYSKTSSNSNGDDPCLCFCVLYSSGF